jgi:hypothetical protein
MNRAKHCLSILVLILLPTYDALSYDYTWYDYLQPFTQLVRVPAFTSGSSTVYLDLPDMVLNSHRELTLNIDIESNILLRTDGLEQRGFNYWNAYCSVNGAGLFGKHRIPVTVFPPRQTCKIVIATKDLNAGRNTLEFSMSPGGGPVTWTGIYGKEITAYGIHRMWFSELSAPP